MVSAGLQWLISWKGPRRGRICRGRKGAAATLRPGIRPNPHPDPGGLPGSRKAFSSHNTLDYHCLVRFLMDRGGVATPAGGLAASALLQASGWPVGRRDRGRGAGGPAGRRAGCGGRAPRSWAPASFGETRPAHLPSETPDPGPQAPPGAPACLWPSRLRLRAGCWVTQQGAVGLSAGCGAREEDADGGGEGGRARKGLQIRAGRERGFGLRFVSAPRQELPTPYELQLNLRRARLCISGWPQVLDCGLHCSSLAAFPLRPQPPPLLATHDSSA